MKKHEDVTSILTKLNLNNIKKTIPPKNASKLNEFKGRTNEIITAYVGVGKNTFRKAEAIVKITEAKPETWGELIF